jgi:hypothetical protein
MKRRLQKSPCPLDKVLFRNRRVLPHAQSFARAILPQILLRLWLRAAEL